VITWKNITIIDWGNNRICVFCGEGQGKMEHFVSEYNEVRERFRELSVCKEERLARIGSDDLDREKGKVLKNFWKEKEKRMRIRKKEDIARVGNCNKG